MATRPVPSIFRASNPPKGYVPGLGRGATGFSTRGDVGAAVPESAVEVSGTASRSAEARAILRGVNARNNNHDASDGVTQTGAYDQFEGYVEKPVDNGQFADNDEDDNQADQIWAAIDERMKHKRKRKNETANENGQVSARTRISSNFRDAKEALGDMTQDMWAAIPDVQGDVSLKLKQRRRQEAFTPISDSLLEQRHERNADATAGNARMAGTVVVDGTHTSMTNMSGLSAARGTVLGMSLDKQQQASAASGLATTVVDAAGYLTSLAETSTVALSGNSVQDIHKARLLLKSVRDTNPKHGPGWIASARVEEVAGKLLQARKIIQEACQVCPDNEDVWLEAARLHPQGNVAKSILATAVRRIPASVKLFLRAVDMEQTDAAKKAVLRKGLETNPTSVTLWKAAIELEDADNARILLSIAVEKVPHAVEFWLALARLESYENAQKILNKARKALATERTIWIAAAKLEESQSHDDIVDKIIERAVKSLQKNEAVVTRVQWLQEAENAEASDAPITSAAIVKYTIGIDVDDEDRQRTWADDAKSCLARGSVATARAILSHALSVFPTKRSFWMQAVELERKHGTATTLDEVLAAASERQPNVEIFWLLRAKEQWLAGNVDKAREVLTEAFKANPESEAVWLAAAKLEWETGELERARVLLQRARERAPTDRVFMKSALFERQHHNYEAALHLIDEGITKYPQFAKLYCMGGQICSDDLAKNKKSLDRARRFYQRGLEECPTSTVLWILASRLEERSATFTPDDNANPGVGPTKARSLLELARLKIPKSPELWIEAIRLERRNGNAKLAETLMARALQDCPQSGLLLAENIYTAPRVEQKSKSSDAVKRCPEDPLVIVAVASLFASERKTDKARKWFDRAVILNPDLGDSWARFYAFELTSGSLEEQQKVKERCVAAEPKHGEIWTSLSKAMENLSKNTGEILELASKAVTSYNRLH
ncbi:hypothetical protein MPSEU_000333300 [Mayamaea pseudoterrestris]|nr:hypothetical protein MPSEU_000333300 [Mayamaea pseudoterrestris]